MIQYDVENMESIVGSTIDAIFLGSITITFRLKERHKTPCMERNG